jgi:putative membrane protein
MMRKLLLRWLINVAATYVAMSLVEGIHAEGGGGTVFGMALILGLVNALIAPLIKALTCPLILLTLGLFTLVVNALMFWLASVMAAFLGIGFYVDSFGAAFWGALVVSIVSFVLSALTGIGREKRR